jgi:hypothetical protein
MPIQPIRIEVFVYRIIRVNKKAMSRVFNGFFHVRIEMM